MGSGVQRSPRLVMSKLTCSSSSSLPLMYAVAEGACLPTFTSSSAGR